MDGHKLDDQGIQDKRGTRTFVVAGILKGTRLRGECSGLVRRLDPVSTVGAEAEKWASVVACGDLW